MKLLPVFALQLVSLSCVVAQGLVNFFNNSTTLITWGLPNGLPWHPQSVYFALLTSPVGANNFTLAGVYGTIRVYQVRHPHVTVTRDPGATIISTSTPRLP